jgi:hypothetical protein
MNTEQRVLAMLSKVKQIKLDKKENLGAIEDAINQVKVDLSNKGDMIIQLVSDYNSDIDDKILQAKALGEDLLDLMMQTDGAFNQLEEEYLTTAKELDDLGISYDSIFPDLGSDYNDAKNFATDLADKLGI